MGRDGGSAVAADAAPHPGVQYVPQGVAEHADAIDGDAEGDAGPDRHPWGQEHVVSPAAAEHASPQLGSGGGIPKPRKLRPASIRMISGTSIVNRITAVGRMLGRMCLNRILGMEQPVLRAASTNISCFTDRAAPR